MRRRRPDGCLSEQREPHRDQRMCQQQLYQLKARSETAGRQAHRPHLVLGFQNRQGEDLPGRDTRTHENLSVLIHVQFARIEHDISLISQVEIANFQHPLPNRVPYKDFSYSDHEGVMATLKFIQGQLYIYICLSYIVFFFYLFYISLIVIKKMWKVCTHVCCAGEHGTINTNVTDSLKEAIEICENALRSVQRQRFWYLLSGCILIVPLLWSIGLNCLNMSLGIEIGLNIARIILTAILCYTLFMSTIWNSVEKNALRAGCLGIEIYMTQLNNDRAGDS